MKLVKKILLGLLALAVLLGLISFALPRTYRVERSIDINAPMIAIYPRIYNPKDWALWSVWNRRDPGMAMTYSGEPAGRGAKWAWQSTSEGSGKMEFTAAEFDKLIAYKITFTDFDGELAGRFEFSQAGKAVRVRWIGEGDVGGNPIMRYFAIAMDRMIGPDFEGGLNNLKALAEATR